MLIRSQDKRILVNFNNVASICSNGMNRGIIEAVYPATNEATCLYDTLGCYSTEEKAIKVLDMIAESQRKICNSNSEIITDGKNIKQSKHYFETDRNGFTAEYAECILFQMPQDSEVIK